METAQLFIDRGFIKVWYIHSSGYEIAVKTIDNALCIAGHEQSLPRKNKAGAADIGQSQQSQLLRKLEQDDMKFKVCLDI